MLSFEKKHNIKSQNAKINNKYIIFKINELINYNNKQIHLNNSFNKKKFK